jgi:hypothetical protein
MDGRNANMKISLMFTGSDDILQKCRPLRREVTDLVSSKIVKTDYGTTLDLLLVNVVIQDTEMLRLGTKLSRKSKDIRVDIPLSWRWVKQSQDSEIKLALLECLVKAVEITRQRLTRKDDDFEADELIADLKTLADKL